MDTLEIKEQLVKNTFWGVISGLLNRIGGFILIIFISRMLMPEGFGRYSLVMTIALFFITFSDFGVNQTLIRYVSLEMEKENGKAVSYFKYFFKIRFFLTCGLSLILLSGARIFSSYIFKDSNLFMPLIILSFFIFFTSLTGFFESLFFIKKNVRYTSIKEFFSIIFKLFFILIVGFFIPSELRLITILSFITLISIFIFLFIFYLSRKKYPLLFKDKEKTPINKKDVSKFMLLLNIQNLALLILSNVTIVLLGIFLSSEFVGYYNSSWALISGVIGLLFSFSYTFLPVLSNTKEETFQIMLKKIFRLSFILALPISFGLSLLSKFFIFTIYGDAYLFAVTPLSILSFTIPLIAGINLSLDSFSARNKQKKFSTTMLFFSLIFIFFNYLFIKFLYLISGELTLIGVAIINLILWSICFLCATYLLKKELNINIFSKDLIKSILSCFIMSIFILFSLKLLGNLTIFSGISVILLSAIIYFLSLFLMKGITKEDFALINKTFKKR